MWLGSLCMLRISLRTYSREDGTEIVDEHIIAV